MEQIITAYQKQAVQQNISKNELIRLQAGLIELESEISENQLNMNEYQKQLKSLTNIPPEHIVEIKTTSMEIIDPIKLSLAALLEASEKSRPDVKRHQLQAQYFEKALLYEKSQRVPDITLHASYDRYGGVWKDFVGFGVSFNLPFLNRNQGQIKAAAISVKQSQHLHLHQHNLAQHEITEALQNYTQVHRFYTKITSNSLLEELDQILQVYTKNMLTRNISILEYIDFIESFKNSKQSLLNSKKLVNASFEELQYVVGTDITH